MDQLLLQQEPLEEEVEGDTASGIYLVFSTDVSGPGAACGNAEMSRRNKKAKQKMRLPFPLLSGFRWGSPLLMEWAQKVTKVVEACPPEQTEVPVPKIHQIHVLWYRIMINYDLFPWPHVSPWSKLATSSFPADNSSSRPHMDPESLATTAGNSEDHTTSTSRFGCVGKGLIQSGQLGLADL